MGRSEQEVGEEVDLNSIFLLRPGERRIMRAQPGFDVGERDGFSGRGARSAERARRIALHDDEFRFGTRQHRCECLADHPHVRVRIGFSDTIEADDRETVQPVIRRVQLWMLPGENQRWSEAALVERCGDRRKLDGFGTCTDDE